jgi:peptide/nickel transport system permease protein
MAPAVQVIAQNLQYLVGGIIVVEYLYAYPGLGKELVDAVAIRDVREVQSIAILIAAVYITINIVADLLVVLLVPKLRTSL